jgi:sRNA-binding protein
MLHIKSKKISLLVCFCVISGLLSPALTQADVVNAWGGDSGSIDAGKAAAQREAAAKRAAKKQKKVEEKKAAETEKAPEAQKEKTVAK